MAPIKVKNESHDIVPKIKSYHLIQTQGSQNKIIKKCFRKLKTSQFGHACKKYKLLMNDNIFYFLDLRSGLEVVSKELNHLAVILHGV